MKKLPIVFAVLILCSCRNLMNKHQNYVDNQKKGMFTADLSSPQIVAGETEAQFDSAFPFVPLKNSEVAIIYFPVEDAVCLKYRIDTYTFYQFWSRESREAFLEGLENYNKDFDAQKLGRFSGRTRNAYGVVNGYLIWQSTSLTKRAYGHIEMEIGYYFKERSPFFTITQGNALLENYLATEENREINSGERPVYFTKSQAAKIAECFDQQYLLSIVPESMKNTIPVQRVTTPVEFDSY